MTGSRENAPGWSVAREPVVTGMRLPRALCVLLLVLFTAGCAVEMGARPSELAAARHVSDEPPYIAIVSMVNRSNEKAAHTALFINASEQVIYDPAGTFDHADMPERGDIHYGATPRMISYYERYHARFSHYVHIQKLPVSAEIAEMALRRAQAQGPSPKLFCTVDTIAVLSEVPGFEGLQSSFYPQKLRDQVAVMPGVIDSYRFEDDREKALPAGA